MEAKKPGKGSANDDQDLSFLSGNFWTSLISKSRNLSKEEKGGILALVAILIALGAVLLYSAGSIGLYWDQSIDSIAVNSKLANAAQSSVSGLEVWRLDQNGIPEPIGNPATVDPVVQAYLDDACRRTVANSNQAILSGKVFRVTNPDCASVTTADLDDVSNCIPCLASVPDCTGLEIDAQRVARESGELGSCLGLFILAAKAGETGVGQQVQVAAPLREAAPQPAVSPGASASPPTSPSASPSSSPPATTPTPTPTVTPPPPSDSPTPTPTPTDTPTPTPTPTDTPTPTPTDTPPPPSDSPTPTKTPTDEPTEEPTLVGDGEGGEFESGDGEGIY